MTAGLDWALDGADWPNRAHSLFVQARGLRWHVQRMGAGPTLLLLHGTGAATHSWRGLLPLLSASFDVVAPDLPGHGFTDTPPVASFTLPGMARAVSDLLVAMGVSPGIVVGHSAGAAIGARACLDGLFSPQGLVSLNGALLPFPGLAGTLFPRLAKLLFANPFASGVFALQARQPDAVPRLLREVGPEIDAAGLDFYRRLLRSPRHVGGALRMMAHWDLESLKSDLPKLPVPLLLYVGERDRAVRPETAHEVAALVPGARIVSASGLGHLAHEEDPVAAASVIVEAARAWA